VVYVIQEKNGDVYVGKSGGLTKRLLGHLKKKDLADEPILCLKRNTDHDPFYEMKMTMHCMTVFGIQNVEGSIWAPGEYCELTQEETIYCAQMFEDTNHLTTEQLLATVKADYEAARDDIDSDTFTRDILKKIYCDGYDLCYGTLVSVSICSCDRHKADRTTQS
jgi:hypothetical protein